MLVPNTPAPTMRTDRGAWEDMLRLSILCSGGPILNNYAGGGEVTMFYCISLRMISMWADVSLISQSASWSLVLSRVPQ